MNKIIQLICVSCPLGCDLIVTCDGNTVCKVDGNSCPRGVSYAKTEIQNPRRVFASTVRVKNGKLPVCPVRSKTPVPKEKLLEIAQAIAKLEVEAPIVIGQVLLEKVCKTNVSIITTRSLAAEK